MKMRTAGLLFLLCGFFSWPAVHAAAPLVKVLVTTGSSSEREGALYVAQDQGYFRKYGLDVTLVQVRNGPVGMAALSSGESLLHWGSFSGANLGAIAEGADLVFVAGFINRLTGAFAINPKITSPAELKGKSVGVNSLSGGTWIFTMLALDHWGLSPERDKIQFRGLGDNSVVSQALVAGNIDAAYLSYTYAKIVHNKGYRVLADLEKLPIAYQGTGIITRKNTMVAVPAPARKCRARPARRSRLHPQFGKQVASNKKSGQGSPAQAHRRRRGRLSIHGWPLREKNLSRASTVCAMSSACLAPVTKRFAVSKPRTWWTTVL